MAEMAMYVLFTVHTDADDDDTDDDDDTLIFYSIDCSLVFNQDHIDHCRNIIALSIMENCART